MPVYTVCKMVFSTATEEEEVADTDVQEADADLVPDFQLAEPIPPLPSEGVSYSRLTEEDVQALVNKLTSVVYQRVAACLHGDQHRLLFATLLCLTMQEEGLAFSEEELSLLLQGTNLMVL